MPTDSPDRTEFVVIGTPESAVSMPTEFARLGVGDFILAVRPPLDWETITIMVRDVRPALRGLAEPSGRK